MFKNKFSIGHPEMAGPDQYSVYYQLLKNSSQETLNEIQEIYFGKFFYYNIDGVDKRYGNCMGVESTDEQIDYLFKIQNELGIPISLTMNSLEIPLELQMNKELIGYFYDWIGSFYDRGLRSCTIASTHMVRDGELQRRFPEMRWKNTVNHLVSDAQQVIDMIHCGYDTILLDRSLNRNIAELKRIKKAVDYMNAKKNKQDPHYKPILTSLLISESCLYRCPFKKEHDDMGSTIAEDYFNTHGYSTCNAWRAPGFGDLPRNGVDLIVLEQETMEKIASLVDIFKHSGRLDLLPFNDNSVGDARYTWTYRLAKEESSHKFAQGVVIMEDQMLYSETFQEIVDQNAAPIYMWDLNWNTVWNDEYKLSPERYNYIKDTFCANSLWFTEEIKDLEKTLFNCRSQCWDCHKCEHVFGVQEVDSALQFKLK